MPEDYPVTLGQWLAMVLFSLGLRQLFLVFAPFAWLIRLFGKREPAFVLTVLFGVAVMLVRNYRAPAPLPAEFQAGLLVAQAAAQVLSVYLFLRGGVLLVWWWTVLLQSRLLFI